MSPLIVATCIAVAALLVAEHRGSRRGIWVAKPLASIGFIATALAADALSSTYGLAVLAALVLSLGGDVLLIPKDHPALFRAGLLSFLLAHVAFAVAFVIRGVDIPVSAIAAILAVTLAAIVLRWLRPHVTPDMRVPVQAYVLVISVMWIASFGAAAAAPDRAIAIGASMFFVSDLAVARDRFVSPGFVNGLWGLPLYFGGQLVLATSVASVG